MKGNMSPSRGSGKNRGLTFGSHAADRAGMGSSWNSQGAPGGARRSRESGQALVEFALILPFFLLIVFGIIQFGIGLNYWLDLNRIANQGARWAVVDHGWENCPSSAPKNEICTPTLQDYLKDARVSGGHSPKVRITFQGTETVGNPVTVEVVSCHPIFWFLGGMNVTLRGRATMRIEQSPSRFSVADNDFLPGQEPCP